MFGAKQAREILEDRNLINASMWYEKWKYDLFEWIQNQSLKGINSLLIESEYWGDQEYKKNYLINELKSLDYTITDEDKSLIISW